MSIDRHRQPLAAASVAEWVFFCWTRPSPPRYGLPTWFMAVMVNCQSKIEQIGMGIDQIYKETDGYPISEYTWIVSLLDPQQTYLEIWDKHFGYVCWGSNKQLDDLQ